MSKKFARNSNAIGLISDMPNNQRELKFGENDSLKLAIFYAIFAFIFSVLARLYWVWWASDFTQFFHNGELMISTNDGYAFAEGARDMLAGFHQPNDLSYVGMSLSTLTFWIVKFLGLKLEFVMLYLSVFLGSLVVIPVIFIAREYFQTHAGLVAGLLAGTANSYYNRTMTGYYDTDMLNIVIAMFMLWAIVRVCQRRNVRDIIYPALMILVYNWWYLSGFSLIVVTIALFFGYTTLFDRKNFINYACIALMLIALANFDFWLKILTITLFYVVFLSSKFHSLKSSFIALLVAFCIFGAGGGLDPIIFQLKFYVFRQTSELDGLSFNFFNVNQTIQESGLIDLELFATRISASVVVFVTSLIGVAMFALKYRSFVVTFGMIALGFLALKSGLRFTIYAVPVMGLGFGFALIQVIKILKLKSIASIVIYALASIFALTPVAFHIYEYKISPVFNATEVDTLERFKSIAGREDYVLAWWDYGYPIRYYSDVKTLIDGGKHLGRDNFAVSFALAQNQLASANMARFEVEYTERGFAEKFSDNLAKMISETNTASAKEFLDKLNSKSASLPAKTREIYYYLPRRMISIFPTILQFSRLDLATGRKFADPLFFSSQYYEMSDQGVHLGSNLLLTNDLKSIKIGGKAYPLKAFYETTYENNALLVNGGELDANADIYVIYMRDDGRFLVLDEEMFNSAFVQLFVLERFDESLFEPVILEKEAKIFRLKR